METSELILILVVLAVLAVLALTALVLMQRSRAERTQMLRAAKNLVQDDFLNYGLHAGSLPRPPSRRLLLYVSANTDPAQHYVFDPAKGVRIGRDAKCEVSIQDPCVSHEHCRIALNRQGGAMLYDLGSANGTLLRRGPFKSFHLRGGTCMPLRTGDRVCAGSLILRVRLFWFDDAVM